jgi:hypothetical protein
MRQDLIIDGCPGSLTCSLTIRMMGEYGSKELATFHKWTHRRNKGGFHKLRAALKQNALNDCITRGQGMKTPRNKDPSAQNGSSSEIPVSEPALTWFTMPGYIIGWRCK